MAGKFSWGWFFGVGGIILLAALVIGFLAYQNVLSAGLTDTLPQGNEPITFTETGAAEQFVVSNLTLLAQPVVHEGSAVILESKPIPATGEQAVLARVSGTDGVTLGIIHANGNLEPLISDGSAKTDLQVTSENVAVFVVNANPVTWAHSPAAAGPAEDAIVDVTSGTASGPVDSGVPYTGGNSFGSATSQLFAVDLLGTDHAARLLGEGKSPRRRADGSIVAITAQGISKLNPQTGTSSVILPYPYGDAVGSAISDDGVNVLLRTDGNSILDAYRVSGDTATSLGSIVSRESIYGSAFSADSRVFVRTGENSVALYKLTDAAGYPLPPSAHLPLVMAQ